MHYHRRFVHSFLCTTLLTLRSPLILAKHSICLLSDLWLLSSLSHAFKAPYTPELILGANHHPLIPMAPGPHSLFKFHSYCPSSTSNLPIARRASPPHSCISGALEVLPMCFMCTFIAYECVFYESDQHG